jgi:hypothetical protein
MSQAFMSFDFSPIFEKAFASAGPKLIQAVSRGQDDFGNAIMSGQTASGQGSRAPAHSSVGDAFSSGPGSSAASARPVGANLPNVASVHAQFQSDLDRRFTQGLPELNAAYRADEATSLARVINATRRAGFSTSVSPEERDMLTQAQGTIGSSLQRTREQIMGIPGDIGRLGNEIAELTRALQNQTGETRENTAKLITARESELQRKVGESGQAAARAESLAEAAIAQKNALAFGGMGGTNIAGMIAAGGSALSVAGQIPGLYRAHTVAGAGIDNFMGRAAMGGDIDQLLAMQRLGGEDSVRFGSRLEAGLGVVGNLGATAAAGIGAFYTGGMTAPLALGFGQRALSGMANFNGATLDVMNERAGAERSRNAELFGIMGAGRGSAINALQAARGIGSPRAEAFIRGAQVSEDDALAAVGAASTSGAGPDQFGLLPSGARGFFPTRAGTDFDSLSLTSKNLAMSRASGNIASRAQQLGMTGRLPGFLTQAASFGVTDGMNGGLDQLLTSEAAGIGNAVDVFGGFVQGGMGQGQAAGMVTNLADMGLSSGIDPTQLQGFLGAVGADASTGIGAGGPAAARFSTSMRVANGMFGANPNRAEASFAQRAVGNLEGFGRQRGGLGAVAGFRAVSKLQEQLSKQGITLTPEEEAIFQTRGVTKEGLEALAKRHKTSIAGAGGLADSFSTMRIDAAQEVGDQVGAGTFLMAEATGATTDAEAFASSGVSAAAHSITPIQPGNTTTRGTAAAAANTPGGQAIRAMESVDYVKISTGLNNLSTNVTELSKVMISAIENIQTAAKKQGLFVGTQPKGKR